MVESSQYYQLKRRFYKIFSSCYYQTGNIEQYKKYNTRYSVEQELKDTKSREIAELTLGQLRLKVAAKQNRIWSVWVLVGVLGLGAVVVIIVIQRKHKKNSKRFQEIIEKLRKGQTIETSPSVIKDNIPPSIQIDSNNQTMNGGGIAKDTEERILMELSRLELTPEEYLQSNVSLSKIATIMDTNTKYLTLTIRKHYQKSFNAYVNDFRISYILNKLQKEPKYLEYKISYLAEESGFSSHSKFSSEFKRVVGMPPSVFIRQLKKAYCKCSLR